MRRLLSIVLTVLALAAPAHGAAPPVTARAYVVLNASTGEVLAARDAHARVPVASLTKLMTVLVARQHAPLGQSIDRASWDTRRGSVRAHEAQFRDVDDVALSRARRSLRLFPQNWS